MTWWAILMALWAELSHPELADMRVLRRPLRYSTTTTTSADLAPSDWSGSMVAWWDEEEADNATALNHSGVTCGTDCNLTDVNTVPRDTTNFVEGIKAASFTSANNEAQNCADATCDELDCTGSNDLTIGLWLRPTLVGTAKTLVTNGTGNGYQLKTNTTPAVEFLLGAGTQTTATSGTISTNTWVHAVGQFSDASNTMQVFLNGATSGSSATQGTCGADGSSFQLGVASGQIDEAFIAKKTLTAAQICRICSCGIGGKKCLCDGTVQTLYKACTADADCQTANAAGKCSNLFCTGVNGATNPGCGSCTLASCNASAP